jgi:hypothetical protein
MVLRVIILLLAPKYANSIKLYVYDLSKELLADLEAIIIQSNHIEIAKQKIYCILFFSAGKKKSW